MSRYSGTWEEQIEHYREHCRGLASIHPDFAKRMERVNSERLLSPDETRQALTTCQFRMDEARKGRIDILFEGQWLGVCRTDLYDDVATTWANDHTLEEWVAFYIRQTRLGARVTEARFAVIDAYSDG